MKTQLDLYVEQIMKDTERQVFTSEKQLWEDKKTDNSSVLSFQDSDLKQMISKPEGNILINAHVSLFREAIPHNHTWYELTYVHKGKFHMTFASDEFILKTGDFALINPGVTHNVDLETLNAQVINILMKQSLLQGSFLYMILDNQNVADFLLPAVVAGEDRKNYQIYRGRGEISKTTEDYLTTLLREYCGSGYYSDQALSLNLAGLFLELTRIREDRKKGQIQGLPARKRDFSLADVYTYLNEHLDSATLADTAAYFGYNSRYFSQRMREACGLTFTELLQELRLTKAALLLEKSELPVKEIITICGYENTSYFYKIFQQKYGVKPAEYRVRHTEDA